MVFIITLCFVFYCECRGEKQEPLFKKSTMQIEIESQEVIVSTDGTIHDKKGNWLYYKEDWYKYVDGITEAFFPEISFVWAQYSVSIDGPTLKGLQRELNLSTQQIMMVKEIAEISTELSQLGMDAGRLENKVWGWEGKDSAYREIPEKRYRKWKKELEECYEKITNQRVILKKKTREFLKTLSENKRSKFFSWKEKKREEYRKKEQSEWEKQQK